MADAPAILGTRRMFNPLRSLGLAFLTAAALPLIGQIQPEAPYEGQLLPIVRVYRDYAEVATDGFRHEVSLADFKVVAGSGFADGHVAIRNVRADLNPLRHASPHERAEPNAVRFRYSADLVADRSLPDCYALLTFVSEGSVGTHLVKVGHLRPGDPHHVRLELPVEVGKVGSLHIFAAGREVRTNEHDGPYDMRSYYASLLHGQTGLPATALLKMAKDWPHVLSPDGRFLATFRERNGKQLLIVIDLASMKVVQAKRVADENAYLADPTWVSDHQIAYVAQDDVEFHPRRQRLCVIDVRTG
ncbi:MAG: hypothetical protein ACREFX_05835, partial [Opitutaceae bacterium]